MTIKNQILINKYNSKIQKLLNHKYCETDFIEIKYDFIKLTTIQYYDLIYNYIFYCLEEKAGFEKTIILENSSLNSMYIKKVFEEQNIEDFLFHLLFQKIDIENLILQKIPKELSETTQSNILHWQIWKNKKKLKKELIKLLKIEFNF